MRHLRNQISEEELRNKLLPHYALGCTRIIVSNEYLPAMGSPNVKLHVDPITSVDSGSIETELDGRQNIDVTTNLKKKI